MIIMRVIGNASARISCVRARSRVAVPSLIGDVASRELQCQHEGGSCEFFLLCWMSSGLLQGSCGGFMRGCCHRTAKSANLGTSDISNTVDLTNLPSKDYGPVVNDPSESTNKRAFPKSMIHLECAHVHRVLRVRIEEFVRNMSLIRIRNGLESDNERCSYHSPLRYNRINNSLSCKWESNR